ncbi:MULTISPECIES: low molecular weight protein tyrosine phosphatase family protein [unclassified Pseudomonas]|uniref:low molecular weight protein tyrosine phosphatase family protein n=1 Tax=unclassified Pseudomonas TaxID=196821 RepID=UPI00244C9DA5|nr:MULTISPECIES: low molecular weight protein tyrosine phosphatase family protein [unclassified Pseudomonas]MDH0481776.1 low molecular weight protein tyrosine phosphatase family protein [Pseudomonas sp. GD04015]MDH0603148.1 low molecular weight protein tyrosine phosphatase family protein [Pseudomonas sp. GD03869]
MTRALFICSRNRLRSPTAEQLFAGWPGVESDSTGLAPDAEVPLSAEQVEWADLIFVMERAHQKRLQQRFGSLLRGRRVICLGIPDDYDYMQPELVELLEARVGSYLR